MCASRILNNSGRVFCSYSHLCTPSGWRDMQCSCFRGRLEEVWSSANSLLTVCLYYSLSHLPSVFLFSLSALFLSLCTVPTGGGWVLWISSDRCQHILSKTNLCSLLNGKWSINQSAHFLQMLGKIASKMLSNGSANVKHREIIMISAMSRAWGVRAFFFFEFSKITYKAFVVVVMKWTQEKCGFSYDDNWGINIEKNDKWEALISILVEKKKTNKEHVGEGKRKENKMAWSRSQRKLNSHFRL